MDAPVDEAGFLPMSSETRGHAIKRRRETLGIFSGYEFERASAEVGDKVPRALLAKVERGTASPPSFRRVEVVLDRLEERIGQESPAVGPPAADDDKTVEFRLSGNFGVDVVVKGPVSDMNELEGAVARLIREMRDRTD